MNKTDYDFLGGFPEVLDDFIHEQEAIREAFKGAMSGFGITSGSNFIISGVVWTGLSIYSDGFMFLNGEIFRVDAALMPTINPGEVAVWAVDVTFDSNGNKSLENTASVSAYQIRRAKVISAVYDPAIHMLADGNEPTLVQRIFNIIDFSPLAARKPLTTKVISIGDWNMVSTTDVIIAHGLPDIEKIRSVNVMIRANAGYLSGSNAVKPLDSRTIAGGDVNGGVTGFTSGGSLILSRTTGGDFDSAAYNSISYNRGYVTIEYEE